jgi:hypothetical protein
LIHHQWLLPAINHYPSATPEKCCSAALNCLLLLLLFYPSSLHQSLGPCVVTDCTAALGWRLSTTSPVVMGAELCLCSG